MTETSTEWQGMQLMRSTLFREVYKNAWLKMMIVGSKKKDKLWIVFCVHDDTDAYLEAYLDNKVAATHNPHWFVPLNNTLHITPSICPQDEEYEFVITLQTDVIRLSAPSWQLMSDWVETMRRKLLEMKVLTPKENVYSKLPEMKNVNLLPTRDPTSPLPPPPNFPVTIVPGVEPVQGAQIFTYEAAASITNGSNGINEGEGTSTDDLGASALTHYEHLCAPVPDGKICITRRAHRSASNCDRHRLLLEVVCTDRQQEQEYEGQNQSYSDQQPQHQQPWQQYGVRRRSSSLSETRGASGGICLTLRAQQVMQLRKEIMHPAGIRLKLKRRDCIGSIALVDVSGSVWIAGWKQKEHPMLYNALHIGDKLISIQGISVYRAIEAHRFLSGPGLHVDLVIKRLPYGQVFAIRKDVDGQSLGIVQEDGSAVIKEVLPNGLAARHGLPSRAPTCDGLSFTNWVLTEINSRPLNLFFKDNEIKDRLNSVGRDISILVQPMDLLKQLKKQLKSIRNYKEFILQ